jgi:hypothetical protein
MLLAMEVRGIPIKLVLRYVPTLPRHVEPDVTRQRGNASGC